MSAVILTAAPSTRATAVTQVRLALSMISSDPQSRALLSHQGSSAALADWLYARWWCGPGLRDRYDAGPGARTEAEVGAARLEASRRATAPRSGGWLVLATVGDALVAALLGGRTPDERDTRLGEQGRLTTTPDAVVSSSRPGQAPRPGDLVTVRHGSSGLDPAHAWWWAHATSPDALADIALDRWYVHARDLSAAASLVPLLIATADETRCPMTLKCPPTEGGYGRRDALVVYLPRDRADLALQSLLRRADAIAPHVRAEVPPLTRQLLPGVSHAQDPGGSADGPGRDERPISYGQLRCGQVATVAARLLGTHPDLDPTDESLVAALVAVGVDVDAVERVA